MKLGRIAEVLQCRIPPAERDREVVRIASPEDADEGAVVFLADPTYLDTVSRSAAGVAIVPTGTRIDGKILLEVADPYLGYARVAQLFEDRSPAFPGPRHPAALIDETATVDDSVHVGPLSVVARDCSIGPGTVVGAGCVIECECTIGADCRVDSGALIRRGTRMGNHVIVQSGAVVGSEGFGNAVDAEGAFVRIPCFGNVVIEDDVEIGANTTIDRGNFASTILHRGVKIDNLVHIAHNVIIGEHSALAAQAGISGSTRLGRRVMVGGQAGFVGHITIGDRTFVGAQAGVSKGTEAGAKITGYPARDIAKMRRIDASLAQLPQMVKELRKLRRRVAELQERLDA